MIEVNTQTVVFLQSLALGFALGLFYDVFRILRLAVRHSGAAVFLEDVLFFAFCAVVTFLFSLTAVSGHVRVFLVVGEFLGATLYYFSLGALVMRVSKVIIRFVKALLRLLYRIFIRPFVRLARFFARKGAKIGAKWGAKAKKVRATAQHGLKRQSVLVYNLYVKRKRSKNKNGRCKGGEPGAKRSGERTADRESAVS